MAHQTGQEGFSPRDRLDTPSSGQNHDRIPSKNAPADGDIGLTAKMLSATLGSVLTSLLGTDLRPIPPYCKLSLYSHTSRCRARPITIPELAHSLPLSCNPQRPPSSHRVREPPSHHRHIAMLPRGLLGLQQFRLLLRLSHP